MTKRRTILKGSSVLLLALATGCATSPSASNLTSNVGQLSGAGLVANNASGLISNNAGGLISNNAGGLISNNAGGLISNNAGGLISNNAGGLVSNNAGGLISNNAGGLTGAVRGPAAGLISNNAGGLISNNAGGLISNNAGGLISNNAGGLISNNAGGYSVLATNGSSEADDLTEAVPDAKVAVFNERGEQISYAWTTTDGNGNYTFTRLKASGPIVFVKAVYQREGKQVVLISTAPAPRKPGLLNVACTPSTTIVAKKLGEMIRRRAVSVGSVHADSVAALSAQIAPVMSPKAVVAAAILPAESVATTFDNLVKESPVFQASVAAASNSNGNATIISTTPPDVLTPNAQGGSASSNAELPTITASQGGNAQAGASGSASASGSAGGNSGGGSTAGANTGGAANAAVGATPSGGTPSSGGATSSGGGTTASGGTTTTVGGTTASGGTTTTAGGTTSSGGSTSTSTGAPAGAAGSSATVLKSTISTIGSVSTTPRIGMQPGSSSFTAALRTGVTGGTLSSLSSALTFNEDASSTPKAVTFDGSTPYYLIDNTIVGNGNTVTIPGIGAGDTTALAVHGGVAYVSSPRNYIIKVDLASGAATPFSGSPSDSGNFADGSATTAAFNGPQGLCFVGSTLYVADTYNHRIRAVAADGTATTYAGSGAGNLDGSGMAASFGAPTDVTADDQGNLYVADQNNQTIRKVDTTGAVTTIAGNGKLATKDGSGGDASLYFPNSLAWGKVGGTPVLVVSQVNHKIRLVSGW